MVDRPGSRTPPPPGPAATVFGDRLDAAIRYANLLATAGVERGLIGPREVSRLWDRHLLNCAVVADLIPDGSRVIDVGSGAGLPGIPLALARPGLRITLLEPMARRVDFLTEAVEQLGLKGVDVVRSRAEDFPDRASRGSSGIVASSQAGGTGACGQAGGTVASNQADGTVASNQADGTVAGGQAGGADVVTARAVAPLDRLSQWCLPLVVTGGRLLAIKGRSARAEVDATRAAVLRAGGTNPQIRLCGIGSVDPPTTVVEIVRGSGRATRRSAR